MILPKSREGEGAKSLNASRASQARAQLVESGRQDLPPGPRIRSPLPHLLDPSLPQPLPLYKWNLLKTIQYLSPGPSHLVPYFIVFQNTFCYFSIFPVFKGLHDSCCLCEGYPHHVRVQLQPSTKHSTQDIVSAQQRSARSALHHGPPWITLNS